MPSKTTCTSTASVLTASGLNGKSVTDVIITRYGSTVAIEIVFSGGSAFIKTNQGHVDVGGTLDYGTGTLASLGRLGV